MKLTIEFKDEIFKWDYWVGKEEHHGTHPVSTESLQIFCATLSMLSKSYINQHEEFMEKVKARAFLERHYPDIEKIVRDREEKERTGQ